MLPLIVTFAITVFVIALISPRLSRKVERKTRHKATRLKGKSNALWAPLTFLARGALELLKRLTTLSVKGGRRARRETKGDDD